VPGAGRGEPENGPRAAHGRPRARPRACICHRRPLCARPHSPAPLPPRCHPPSPHPPSIRELVDLIRNTLNQEEDNTVYVPAALAKAIAKPLDALKMRVRPGPRARIRPVGRRRAPVLALSAPAARAPPSTLSAPLTFPHPPTHRPPPNPTLPTPHPSCHPCPTATTCPPPTTSTRSRQARSCPRVSRGRAAPLGLDRGLTGLDRSSRGLSNDRSLPPLPRPEPSTSK
jgi:hypothetical protein